MTTPPPPANSGGMNKKIGPLPVWMWAVIGGGGLAAFMYLRSKNSKSATSSGAATCATGVTDSQGNCCESGSVDSSGACAPVPANTIAIVPEPEPTGTTATAPTSTSTTSQPTDCSYTVKAGNTWSSIAKTLGMTPQNLFVYQFSSASGITQQLREQLAEYGPNNGVGVGNVIHYPCQNAGSWTPVTGGTPQSFTKVTNYTSGSASFWPAPLGKNSTAAKEKS
jgi:hypothetical protein